MFNRDELKKLLRLYVVTDYKLLEKKGFYESIEQTLKGGVSIIQLREKDTPGKIFLERALALKKLCRRYRAKLIINDRVDIALLSDADGVHVGQNDIDAKYVRKLIGEDKILGVSVRTVEDAEKAQQDGADYLGIGAMFESSTKRDSNKCEFNKVLDINRSIDIPYVLIGGINLINVEELSNLHSSGFAVISSILNSKNIYSQTQKWIKKIDEII